MTSMNNAEAVDTTADSTTAPERPALLPSAASLQPTHVTSHLPPIKSLQVQHQQHKDRGRSPFRLRRSHASNTESHRPPAYTTKSSTLPSSNTLQTFLSVTDVPHFGHPSDASHGDKLASQHSHAHPAGSAHAWRVRKTPIFSGLLAPFSIVLEVPGLTSKWYAKIDQNGIVERFIDNPPILTVGLAISLAAAVVGNAAIILRFLEILRPRQSIILALMGFVMHDLINVVALATFGGIYGPKKDGLRLSASYWMVCASTTTSVLVTISLVADYVRTKDFRHAGSGLTQLQKGLVLAGMGLLLYLSLGSLIFVFVIKIDFITALYFSCATILTVGFGDVVPDTPGGKILVILYAPIGIVLVALVVSAARNAILETFQATLMARSKERRRRIAERRAAQKEHKRQDRALRKIMPRTFTFGPGAGPASNNDDGNDFAAALARMEHQATAGHDPSGHTQADSGAAAASVDTTADASSDTAKTHADMDAAHEKSHLATAGDPALQREIAALQQHLLTAKQRSEQDFREFEAHARREAVAAARMKLVLAASMTAAFWLLGAVAFTYAERWSYGGAMWFCFISMITIGYGDYHPATQLGRAIFVIWGLMGVAVLTILLAVVQDAFGSIFHRVLTNSTSRLFDRAEARARKRFSRKQKQDKDEEKAEEGQDEHVEGKRARSSSARRRHARLHQRQRKSEGDVMQHRDAHAKQAVAVTRKSMEACIEPPARTASPEPLERTPATEADLALPSLHLEISSDQGLLHTHFDLPAHAAARVEDTLVSTPQKLALAALQTFQHSVRVLQLYETSISQAMSDVPALRNYYNLRQQKDAAAGQDADAALQDLHASIRQTANPEHEKVAKLVVANLEFEQQLRTLLDGFQGLKDQVEGFKQTRLQRSRTISLSGDAPTAVVAQQRHGRESSD
ncbi:related to TOK1-Voltage-gated, outward-rectifying K+ channel protein of the plasma membrane [Sporisorium reilianum SRZ2]|uniref:Related to TOK1-Voltage-gated, outward-rectifying K+ channel protein of the plasma membrane n=1 Tax=Sporisorium reilianum (strain SRZ2) TaxID=999809 RepID=E6ZZY6_SPORE|nr:related to TOK1-Voltage-gated, outward-rectifying K+ channel protein of the plasma membrane [Sporisorium reilianum SRZ2]